MTQFRIRTRAPTGNVSSKSACSPVLDGRKRDTSSQVPSERRLMTEKS
jgi:hypothetical protein